MAKINALRLTFFLCLAFLTLLPAGQALPAHRPPKIVSLAPSNTELVYDVGAQNELVGVSSYCDYPQDAKNKEKVGSFVSANIEKMAMLKPDAVLLVAGQEGMASLLRRHGYQVKVLRNDHLLEIADNLRAIGILTLHQKKAASLASSYRKSVKALQSLTSTAIKHPHILYCVWPQPLLVAGSNSFINDVITACGGKNIAAGLPSPYPQFSLEKLMMENPDLIILPHEAEGKQFLKQEPWAALAAVKAGNVYYLPEDIQDILSRPTPRIRQGLYWLARRIHPELSAELEAWLKE